MAFILSHWHCILPVFGLLIASFFMRKKPDNQINDTDNDKK